MNADELRAELGSLLHEGMDGALERERNTFDQIAGSRPLVLCGAGGMGSPRFGRSAQIRRRAAGLRR